jgi:hypothetical protein
MTNTPDLAPEPKVVDVVDYEFTLNSGKDLPQFSVRADLGDVVDATHPDYIKFTFGATKHEVVITRAQVAVVATRQRKMALMVEFYAAKAKADAGQ